MSYVYNSKTFLDLHGIRNGIARAAENYLLWLLYRLILLLGLLFLLSIISSGIVTAACGLLTAASY
jgi:hypothetical protein